MAKKKYGKLVATKKVLTSEELAGEIVEHVGEELAKRGVDKKWVALFVAVAAAVVAFFFGGCVGAGSLTLEGVDGGRVVIKSEGCK